MVALVPAYESSIQSGFVLQALLEPVIKQVSPDFRGQQAHADQPGQDLSGPGAADSARRVMRPALQGDEFIEPGSPGFFAAAFGSPSGKL